MQARTRRRVVGAGLTLIVASMGAVLVATGRADAPQGAGRSPRPPEAASTPTSDAPAAAALPRLVRTDDPDAYAANVAGVVFGMDTRSSDADDYRRLLRAEADPTLTVDGRRDLERTIDVRVPARGLWARMQGNRQWSSWQTTDVWEPGGWEQVVTGGYAQAGWVMRNVSGVQSTRYHDAGQTHEAARERTVSILMRCPAPGAQVDRCHLALIGTTVVA